MPGHVFICRMQRCKQWGEWICKPVDIWMDVRGTAFVHIWVCRCLRVLLLWHHDQGNSYKGKHLIGSGLQFQRASPLSSWWEALQRTCRHSAGGVKNTTFWSIDSQKETIFCRQPGGDLLLHWVELKHLEPSKFTYTVILPLARLHLFQQGHTS